MHHQECNFYVGQEVVCVNDDVDVWPNSRISIGGLDGLKRGQHYTVAEIFIHSLHNIPCIRVKEIVRESIFEPNPDRPDPDQQGYFAFRFRPVQKRQTDISALEKLLRPIKAKEPV
jgi:hypothetical protein